MIFNKQDLRQMVEGNSKDLKKVEDTILEITYTSVFRDAIFEEVKTGKFYSSGYSVGIGEKYADVPYEVVDDDVDCLEVERKLVEVEQWIEVDAL